jgi:phospholipid transport system substrate-binding protein
MDHTFRAIGRRGALMLTVAAFVGSSARADTGGSAAVVAPVKVLDDALLAAMRSGDAASFNRRYQALEPVIGRVFDLDAVLVASIGLSWSSIPVAQKATLTAAFRRYTVSSYVANFSSYDGQSFEILPDTRMVGNGEVVVPTRLIRRGKTPVKLDYVVRSGPAGWQVVDVLTDGTISRVAVQRSDFRELLGSGGPAALTAGLERTVANLSASAQG